MASRNAGKNGLPREFVRHHSLEKPHETYLEPSPETSLETAARQRYIHRPNDNYPGCSERWRWLLDGQNTDGIYRLRW
jgi:hypothetical protein